MKICCLISSLRLGGAERQMVGLACALAAGGHQVCVVTYRQGNFYEKKLEERGVEHILIHESSTASIVREISAIVKESGIQLVISFLNGANIKACFIKKQCPDLHLIVSERNNNTSIMPHDLFRFLLFKKYADAVVCNSYAQEAFLKRFVPFLIEKVTAIPNSVDTGYFTPTSRLASEKEQRIIVTARVCRRKNASGLIKAAAILRHRRNDFAVDWYGLVSDNRYSRYCRRIIRKYSLENVFFIHGASDRVQELYRNSDIFCLPSYYEGTSNSLAEALSCGLPVVCSKVSDNPVYVREGSNGFLFNPRNAREMAAALEKALDLEPSRKKEFGERSRAVAERSFGIDRMFYDYETVIEGLPHS